MSGIRKKRSQTKKIQLNPVRLRDEMVVAAVETTGNKHEVARTFGISRSTLYGILEKVKKNAPIISNYRSIRAEVNAYNQLKRQEKQDQVLENIQEEDIKQADLRTKMIMLDALGRDKEREFIEERLQRGQSMENVAVIVKAIMDLKKREANINITNINFISEGLNGTT